MLEYAGTCWNILLQGKFGRLDAVVNCAGIGVAFKVYNFNKDKAHTQEDFIKVITLRVRPQGLKDQIINVEM